MVEGKLEIVFDDGDKFNTFHEMMTLMTKAGILPSDFIWIWEDTEDGFKATFFSKLKEADVQKERPSDIP